MEDKKDERSKEQINNELKTQVPQLLKPIFEKMPTFKISLMKKIDFHYPKEPEILLFQRRVLELQALVNDSADPARILRGVMNLHLAANEAALFVEDSKYSEKNQIKIFLKEIASQAGELYFSLHQAPALEKDRLPSCKTKSGICLFQFGNNFQKSIKVSSKNIQKNQLSQSTNEIDEEIVDFNQTQTTLSLWQRQSPIKFPEEQKISPSQQKIGELITQVFSAHAENKDFSQALAQLRGDHIQHNDQQISLVIAGLMEHIQKLGKGLEQKHIVPMVSILAHCMPRWTWTVTKNDNDALYEKNLNLLCADVQINNVEPCHQKIFMDLLQFASFAQHTKNDLQINLLKLINMVADSFGYPKIANFDEKNKWNLPKTSFNPEKLLALKPHEQNYVLQAELFKLIYAYRGTVQPSQSSQQVKDPFEKLICMVYERQDFKIIYQQLKIVAALPESKINKTDLELYKNIKQVYIGLQMTFAEINHQAFGKLLDENRLRVQNAFKGKNEHPAERNFILAFSKIQLGLNAPFYEPIAEALWHYTLLPQNSKLRLPCLEQFFATKEKFLTLTGDLAFEKQQELFNTLNLLKDFDENTTNDLAFEKQQELFNTLDLLKDFDENTTNQTVLPEGWHQIRLNGNSPEKIDVYSHGNGSYDRLKPNSTEEYEAVDSSSITSWYNTEKKEWQVFNQSENQEEISENFSSILQTTNQINTNEVNQQQKPNSSNLQNNQN